jgi:hypothetical protein
LGIRALFVLILSEFLKGNEGLVQRLPVAQDAERPGGPGVGRSANLQDFLGRMGIFGNIG